MTRIIASNAAYCGAPDPFKGSSSQALCDTIQADFRAGRTRPLIRRDPPPLAPALIPTDDVLKLRLAEELEYARRLLEAMGDELSNDMAVVMRHTLALQSVDVVGQILGHIAAVVRSSDPDGAADRIGMSDLKARLRRTNL